MMEALDPQAKSPWNISTAITSPRGRIVNGLGGNLVASKDRHPDRVALQLRRSAVHLRRVRQLRPPGWRRCLTRRESSRVIGWV